MARIKPQTLLLQSKKKKGPSRVSISTIIIYCLLVGVLVLLLVATYRHWSKRSSEPTGMGFSNFEDVEATQDSKYDLPGYAILNTPKGDITVELFKDGAPEIVDKFLDLCHNMNTAYNFCMYLQEASDNISVKDTCECNWLYDSPASVFGMGHFKGMPFHHVIKHYVVQGGDDEGLGAAEDWISKEKLRTKLITSPKHEAFTLGTTKSNQDDKKFGFFITTAPIPDLNDRLIVFGRVVKGQDVVQEIEEVDTDERYQPKSSIGIIDVTLHRDI